MGCCWPPRHHEGRRARLFIGDNSWKTPLLERYIKRITAGGALPRLLAGGLHQGADAGKHMSDCSGHLFSLKDCHLHDILATLSSSARRSRPCPRRRDHGYWWSGEALRVPHPTTYKEVLDHSARDPDCMARPLPAERPRCCGCGRCNFVQGLTKIPDPVPQPFDLDPGIHNQQKTPHDHSVVHRPASTVLPMPFLQEMQSTATWGSRRSTAQPGRPEGVPWTRPAAGRLVRKRGDKNRTWSTSLIVQRPPF